LGVIGSVGSANAAGFYVTDTTDSYTAGDTKCSFREALDTAYYNDCYWDCGCGSPTDWDEIILAAGKTYTLLDAVYVPDATYIHTTTGSPSIIKAGNPGWNFPGLIVQAPGWGAYLYDLRLEGFRRPALWVDQNTWAEAYRVTVRNNSFVIGSGQNASVLVNPGSYIYMENSEISNNSNNIKGGGMLILAGGQGEIWGSNVHHNAASQYGGGVHNLGTFWCTNSTIANNSAGIQGGGLYTYTTATSNLSNCSITNNTAPSNPNKYP
jgi:hypothetical protein